jgi:hypothetical protein
MGFLELNEPFMQKIPPRLEATAISILMLEKLPGK